jgi:hypothetical protein
MPTIGNKGEVLDLLIRQGATFGPHEVTLTDAQAAPIDITGSTFSAQIRKTYNASTIDATFTFAITNAAQGKFTFTLSNTVTAALTAGADEFDPLSQYVWDLEMTSASGRVTPLFYGAVRVFREVSRT